MQVEIMQAEPEVIEVGGLTLGELVATMNREHAFVVQSGMSMVEHAILAGEALHQARAMCPRGEWMQWLDTNCSFGRPAAYSYLRLAEHKNLIRSDLDQPTVSTALAYVRGITPHLSNDRRRSGHHRGHDPSELYAEAERLHAEGITKTEIGRLLGVSRDTVAGWLDPAVRARIALRAREQRRLSKERKLEKARAQHKREARRRGSAYAELYAASERMQDLLSQAHREAEDHDARRALSEAGVHYRKMRDEIVSALGVA